MILPRVRILDQFCQRRLEESIDTFHGTVRPWGSDSDFSVPNTSGTQKGSKLLWKEVPLSETNISGLPKIWKREDKCLIDSLDEVDLQGKRWVNRVNASTTSKICLQACLDSVSGPKWSMCRTAKGSAFPSNTCISPSLAFDGILLVRHVKQLSI